MIKLSQLECSTMKLAKQNKYIYIYIYIYTHSGRKLGGAGGAGAPPLLEVGGGGSLHLYCLIFDCVIYTYV